MARRNARYSEPDSFPRYRSAPRRVASNATEGITTSDEFFRFQSSVGNRATSSALADHGVDRSTQQGVGHASMMGLHQAAGNRAIAGVLGRPVAQLPVQRDLVDDERLQPNAAQTGGATAIQGPAKDALTPMQSSRARERWGKVKGAVDKSRTFNRAGETPEVDSPRPVRAAAAAFADAGARRAARGGTKRDESKTNTAGGAWLANQMGDKAKIGNVEEYTTIDQRAAHLKQFLTGAHAFITPWVHKAIFSLHEDPKNNWGSWGADYNFVAPLSEADKLIEAASAPGARGLFDLEVALGVPEGQWVRGCAPDYSIYRYKVMDPTKLNMRIPSGKERNAYGSWWDKGKFIEGQWEPKGMTSGGAAEAVIDKVSLADLETLPKSVLEIELCSSMAANTKRVLDEQRGQAAAPPSSAPSATAPAPVAAPRTE